MITRAIETDLIHRAGLTRQSGARSGIITLIQRFGSALNLNIHLHMIVLDGVYTFNDDATHFHSVKALTPADMQTLLDRIIRRTVHQLKRDGVLIQDTEQPYFDFFEADVQDTFNAAVSCLPHQRDRLERLCRTPYFRGSVTRPPLALDRLSTSPCQEANGRVVYELKHPFRDGTTHFVFEPLEFLAKLAALIPRPQTNLTRYHGVLAPNAKYRNLVVPTPNRRTEKKRKHRAHTESEPTLTCIIHEEA